MPKINLISMPVTNCTLILFEYYLHRTVWPEEVFALLC